MLLTLLRYVIWIPVALFPLFSPPHAVWWCLVLVAISGFFAAMCNPIYLAWIASVVPREERDRYEASRAGLFVIPAMIMGPVAGHILDAMGERSGFPMVFGIGIGVGLLAMVWYALSEESRAETHGIPSVFGQVRASLSRPRYRALILFSTLLASGTGMILFSVGLILLKFLSASYVFITAWNAASKPGKMLSCFGVGWVSQRFGAIATLRISLLCLGSAPMVLLLAQPDTLYWVPVYLILYGLLDGCVAVPRSVLIMNWVDPKEQTADLAVMYALLTIATSIGTFLGALILHRFAGQQWHFLNRTYVPSHLVLLIGGALVLMSGLSLFRHHGEEPSPS